MDSSSKEKATHAGVEDTKHAEHVGVSEQNPLDYEKLNYGQNGLKGLVSSPYVFGATFLASLGGFSFGYGTHA